MFTRAIVRTPSKNMVNGISSANLGKPDYGLAIEQHQKYAEALTSCGLKVIVLPPDENYPDSTFVEDTAVLTKKCAIVTNPGAESRRGEIIGIKYLLKKYYLNIEEIKYPATLDGGDVLMVGNHFYIGLSSRTNDEGAEQIINILNKYGHSGSVILLKEVLHLKTGVAYLGNNNLVVSGEFIHTKEFSDFKKIIIEDDESYAANSLLINDKVIIPQGYSKTKDKIISIGHSVIELDVSEFRKLDGGLSCLSLRF